MANSDIKTIKENFQHQEDLRDIETEFGNVIMIEKAFRRQKHYFQMFARLETDGNLRVTRDEQGKATAYDFSKCQDENLTVKDVFIMFQNWPTMNESIQVTVTVPIGGNPYTFIIVRGNKYGQITIYNHSSYDPKYFIYATSYKDLFTKVQDDATLDVKQIAAYMLEATEARVYTQETYDGNWVKKYPFLEYEASPQKNLWELLNDIMVIAQVAEAARPEETFFTRWMAAAREIYDEVNQHRVHIWAEKLTELSPSFHNHLDREINRLKLKLSDAKREARNETREIYYSMLDTNGVRYQEFKGRVPCADEIFRKMLTTIKDADITYTGAISTLR